MQKKSFIPPASSLEAFKGIKERKVRVTHATIIEQALRRFKKGNYVQIAGFCGLTPSQVEKRLSEMEAKGIIRKSGTRTQTSLTDKGEVYEIVESPVETPTITKQQTLFAA